MLKGMHHLAIIVSDYEKSKAFYTEKLGFSILRENYRPEKDSWKLDIKLGDCEIELFSMKNCPERPNRPEAYGLRHLAFLVEDIQQAVAELNAKGIETEPIRLDTYTNAHYTFFFDPDGLPLELHE